MTEQDKTETRTLAITLTKRDWSRIEQESRSLYYTWDDRVSQWITRHMHSDADTMWEDN